MAKAVAQDREGPNKRPAVWVQQGGGDIDFSEEDSLEASEG